VPEGCVAIDQIGSFVADQIARPGQRVSAA
jgi:hypothetical protein